MNFLGKYRGEDTKLQMTPMIDIVFQLLIFFLIGTKFRIPEGELEAYLPEEDAPTDLAQKLEDVDAIHITLRVSQGGPAASPSVLLDGKTPSGRAEGGSMGWLEGQLRRLARDDIIRQDVPVIIEAEPHLAYRWVIHTLNTCRRLRFKRVNFAASKRNATLPPGAGKGKAPPG